MIQSRNNTEGSKLLICLNNMGVKEFERGNLEKALNLFSLGLNAVLMDSNLKISPKYLSSKHAMKIDKCWSKSSRSTSFRLVESDFHGTRQRKTKKQILTHDSGPDKTLNAKEKKVSPEVVSSSGDDDDDGGLIFKYQRTFRMLVSKEKPILKQTCIERLMGIILLNLAICHHLLSAGEQQQHHHAHKAADFYQTAFSAFSICGDLYPQLIIWNNLWQIFSEEPTMSRSDVAIICQKQLEGKIAQLHNRDLLKLIRIDDRAGFLSNVILFSHAGQ